MCVIWDKKQEIKLHSFIMYNPEIGQLLTQEIRKWIV